MPVDVSFQHLVPTQTYTLSLHDALPISILLVPLDLHPQTVQHLQRRLRDLGSDSIAGDQGIGPEIDRKSTRLNSSHGYISYAVFCLKKKRQVELHNVRIESLSTDLLFIDTI